MYISGTLAKKVIEEKREHTLNFSDQKIYFSDGSNLSYQGELNYPPFEQETARELADFQEKLINKGTLKLYQQAEKKELCQNEQAKVYSLINKLNFLDRRYAFALCQGLYHIITNMREKYDYQTLLAYETFINTITKTLENDEAMNQIHFTSAMHLFLTQQNYDLASIAAYEKRYFGLDIKEVLEKLGLNIYEIILMGTYIAPERVPIFAKMVWNNPELTKAIAPIVFLLKDEKLASKFLVECRFIDQNGSVEKVAKRNRVPQLLLDLGLYRFKN